MVCAVRFMREVAAAPPFANLVRAPSRATGRAEGVLEHGKQANEADSAILKRVRESAQSLYHPVGTCSMGTVVDSHLRVHGVQNLRVVDASVMPNITSGNTNAATIMLATKASDIILADRQRRNFCG